MSSKPVRVWSADADDMGEKGRRGLDEISRLLNALPTRLSTLVPANSNGYMLEEAISKTPDPYARSQVSLCGIAEEKYYEKRHLMTTDARDLPCPSNRPPP